METIWNAFLAVSTEDYMYMVYGVLLLHVYKWFIFGGMVQKHKLPWTSLFKFWWLEWDDIGKSLVWAGVTIAFDDVIVGWYNGWAEQDIIVLTSEMYFGAGFFIDFFRKAIATKTNFKDPKIDITLYEDAAIDSVPPTP